MTTSQDLVIAGGGGAGTGAWTGRDEVAPRSDIAPEVSKSQPDTNNMELGGCSRRSCPPPGGAGLWSGPALTATIQGHRIPEHPLRSALGPAGTPTHTPGVRRGSPRSRPWGSIGERRRAVAARSLRPLPRSGYAGRGLRAASSRFRAAASLGSPPAREAETYRAPAIGGGGEGTRARAQLPRPLRPAPPFLAPPMPNTLSGARLNS